MPLKPLSEQELQSKKHFDAGLELEEDEKYEEAVKEYTLAIEVMQNAVSHFRRAICYTELKNYAGAIIDLKECLEGGGYRTDGAFFLRANAYIELGKFEEATQDLTSAIGLDPSKTPYYLYRATCLLTLGRYKDAVSDYTILIDNEPVARYYNARGMALMACNQFRDAVSDFTHALEMDKKLVSAYLNRASANQQLKQLDAAVNDLTEAMALEPGNDRAFLARGNLNLHLGLIANAILDYSEAIGINPNEPGYYQNRGAARLLLAGYGNGAEPLDERESTPALEDFSKAIELDPKFADAYAARARLLNSLKDFDAALKDSTNAINLDSTNAIAYAQRAMANRNLGHTDQADLDVAQARQLGWSE
jgi:tetratricopeptide (TPR) repeat protein